MLRTECIDVVNGLRAWAFVGSGASVESGCPSWRDLLKCVLENLPATSRNEIEQDSVFKEALAKGTFPLCFRRVEQHTSRATLEQSVVHEIQRHTQPSDIHREIANWPFAGYVTTNYDPLLEHALERIGGEKWLPLGNSVEEIRKISGDASHVVWHIHGSSELSQDKSNIVITDEDYDRFYAEESPALLQLERLLAQRRLLFVGFGFRDPEVMRLLKRVGRFSNPARPIYAFLSGVSGAEQSAQRKELLEKFNVDAIPYETEGESHRQLVDLLHVYGSLTLKRNLRFGDPERPCPSYHPEVTGLLVFNELCMKGGAKVSEDVLGTLLRARIMSWMNHKGQCSTADIVDDLVERAKLLSLTPRSSEEVTKQVESVLGELVKADLADHVQDSGDLRLTPQGYARIADHCAKVELLSTQFRESLKFRANQIFPGDSPSAARVARAAETFIKDCIKRRALGVAMAHFASGTPMRSYHMVALLQSLPQFMEQLMGPVEAIGLGKLVEGVLASPTESESKFIGMALQAHFGVHILGYDPPTLQARARELSTTFFLVDSSTLIQFLARSSVAYASARMVIKRLGDIGCSLATTGLFLEEVVEHINWAVDTVSSDGAISQRVLEIATGRAGEWMNAFIEGFLNELHRGKAADFFDYLGSTLGLRWTKGGCERADVQTVLERSGLEAKAFAQWDGFTSAMFKERDDEQTRITEERSARNTYKHERQTKAEAEALLICRYLRDGTFKVKSHPVSNAYFMSHSRVLDEVAKPGLPVTMRPEATLHWAATLHPCTIDELECLTTSLFSELAERNLEIVDEAKLQVIFSPFADASSKRLLEETIKHRNLIANLYGEHAVSDFQGARTLDAPLILGSYYTQAIDSLDSKLQKETAARIAAQSASKLNIQDRRELEILRAREAQRRAKAKSRKRAAVSKPRKKKRRR